MAAVTIRVDGEEVEAPEGANLLATLLSSGRWLPHPCFHPALSAPASCRLCLASLDGPAGPELITTCNRPVGAGMSLSVDGPEAAGARERVLDDLLLRHPADCAVCERAGECELQEAVAAAGGGRTPPEAESGERLLLGPRLVLDRRRCILCTRCVRFGEEVAGSPALAVEGRGTGARIAACAGGEAAGPMAGNLLDLCPAGALSDPEERSAPPPWRLRGVASVCAGCASGCATRVDVHAGRVWRVKPRPEGPDGGWWLCDRGRYGWRFEGERLLAPRRGGGETDWDTALAGAAEEMEQARRAAVVLGPYLTSEETFLLIQLARRWRAGLYLWEEEAPEGDLQFPGGFTIRASRGPNAAGVRAVARAVGSSLLPAADLGADADVVYVVGGSLCGEGPEAEQLGAARIIAQDATLSPLAGRAAVTLAGASAWTEKEGTFVDALGRVRRVRAAVEPPGDARQDLWILSALWHGGPNRDSADQVLARLARTLGEPFAGLDQERLDQSCGPAGDLVFGGGWSSWLRQRGLVPVRGRGESS